VSGQGVDRFANAAVEIQGVHKSYGQRQILNDFDLSVRHNEIVCIIGPSGSGKSTLLRCVNHLETLDAGRIRVYGELVGYNEQRGKLIEAGDAQLAARRALMGMVFQRFNLFPHRTALENVCLGPRLALRLSRSEALERGRRVLERVGLADRANAYPAQLSGGQQQRVGIARALAMNPRLILFDEPTSALDPELVGEVLDVIRGLADDGMTMMIVTHEMAFAREVADRVCFIDRGTVVEQGTPPELLDAPTNPRTVSFLSHLRQG
jgi:polar amino acid transport system ATP-binding protein